MYCMLNYDPEKNYYNCIYLLVDTINKTYYCGKTENFNKRILQHRQNKKTYNKIFILEQDCEITDVEYVWLHFFKNKHKVGWTCLNKDFNTGSRFRMTGKTKRYKSMIYTKANFINYVRRKYCKIAPDWLSNKYFL